MNRLLLAALILIFSSPAAFAQTTDGGVLIIVKNQLGEVVPGAEVKFLKAGAEVKTVQTDQQGAARFTKMAPGFYRLEVTAADFKSYEIENFEIRSGAAQKLDITLEISAIESAVSVGGEDAIDTENFGAAKVITEQQIAQLPDDERELEKALKALAGETVTGDQPTITVDGQAGGKIPPKSAIQQVRINQNVFSAQYEGTAGGGIEIFTRSDVKKFTGGGYLTFADSRINARDPFVGRALPSRVQNYSIYLSGPVRKNMSFNTSLTYNQSDTSVAINARGLDADLNPVDIKETFAAPSRSYSNYTSLTYDPNKKNKIALNYYSSVSRSAGQNVGGFSLASRENKTDSQYHNLFVNETFFPNPNTVVQTRLTLFANDSDSFGGDNSPAVNVFEAFFGGGSQNDRRRSDLNLNLSNDTSWQKNRYTLNVGWQIRHNSIKQTSTANFGGTYSFGGRIAPVLDAGNNPVLNADGTFSTAQITSLESYRRTLLFRRLGLPDERIRELGGGATQFTISGGNPELAVNQSDVAFYFQNSYKISETLAASLGVRYENQTNISDRLNFSPRAGLIWSPKAKEKQNPLFALPKISFGAGIFYRRFEVNNFLELGQTAGERFEYLVTDPSVLDIFPTAVSLADLQNFAVSPNRRLIDELVETPRQFITNLSVNKKLPLEFSLNFSATYTRGWRQAQTRNINAPLAGTYNFLDQTSGQRPFENAGNIYETFSNGKSATTRFSVTLNLPQKIAWGNISYSFAKSESNVIAGSGAPFDAYDFSQEWAPTPFDGIHRLAGYFFYDKLPYKISLDGNFEFSSGRRFNIYTGRDTNGDGYFLERPSFASDLSKPGLIATPYGILDPNPAPTDQLIPRNLGRAAHTFTFDLGIGKSFGFGEDKARKKPARQSLYLNVRINNVFNVINRGQPIGNMSSPNFLQILSNSQSDSFYIINGVRSGSGARAFVFSAGFRFN